MATFIELQVDAFSGILESFKDVRNLDFENVRRPFRGIEIKEDTYAIIKVIRSNGQELPLTDAGAKNGPSSGYLDPKSGKQVNPSEGSTFNYSNFIAQRIIDARAEKQQILETFGEPFIFFFGEKPRILNVQGMLINSMDFNWKNEFWKNYESHLRGTKLVEQNARMYLHFDDQIVEGYILNAQASHDSMLPYQVPFNFTMFVTSHTYLGQIESSGLYPISANVKVPADLRDTLSFNEKIRQLRAKSKISPSKLQDEIDQVSLAVGSAASGDIGNKDVLMGAIISGVSDYEARTLAFIENIKTYFFGRRMVVPKGVAGSEAVAGMRQNANKATFVGESPRRTLPLRSKISDNVDEYVGEGVLRANFDQDAIQKADESRKNFDDEEYERKLLTQLASMGVDITEPSALQKLRPTVTNSIVATAEKVDFAAGIANGIPVVGFDAPSTIAGIPLPIGF